MYLKSFILVYLSLNTILGIATSIANGDGNSDNSSDNSSDNIDSANGTDDSDDIKNNYIVVLKPGIKTSDGKFIKHLEKLNSNISVLNSESRYPCNIVRHVFQSPIVGYSGVFNKELLDKINNSTIVDYVESDSVVFSEAVQTSAPWGLARISHRKKLTAQTYRTYLFGSTYYQDATVYVLDTGINLKHQEFEGRASWGATFVRNATSVDDNGHGTHVAGIVAGKTYGVAKKAKLVAVKVLGAKGTGYTSDVIAGINYVLNRVKAQNSGTVNGSVVVKGIINMSLGGVFSSAMNQVINNSIKSGVLFVSAAGNSGDDACKYSPASAKEVIVVGATDITDTRTSTSCYGACVDIFAPGKSITSAFKGSNTATAIYSGTSMAAPHISGLAAYYIMTSSKKLSVQQLRDKILSSGIKGVLSNIGARSPNLLGYNNISG
ncbi:Subtilase-type proteinase psp3 [Zancudomyces culisetae]|uniref:Subtilase-type proteinase psp3 n=1 Tax=Zancudomyces culisetae TaxID=1213189 RepID=A0A1R1PG62_ZANCU|nr:Subtilase-type proteinase psp3 [Zancudomyces culisetae]OMH79843.1 Subtilase-type proteinase psp3 [Zancudomyces culisetae]|eukprot:OMH79842.1 Subtilase-type proteinase psp3 [Zancudomyces culisetae]